MKQRRGENRHMDGQLRVSHRNHFNRWRQWGIEDGTENPSEADTAIVSTVPTGLRSGMGTPSIYTTIQRQSNTTIRPA